LAESPKKWQPNTGGTPFLFRDLLSYWSKQGGYGHVISHFSYDIFFDEPSENTFTAAGNDQEIDLLINQYIRNGMGYVLSGSIVKDLRFLFVKYFLYAGSVNDFIDPAFTFCVYVAATAIIIVYIEQDKLKIVSE